jgi:hypothetical protein
MYDVKVFLGYNFLVGKKGHRRNDSKRKPQPKNRKAPPKRTTHKRERSMTDVLIMASASIAAILGILCGLFYGDHKAPAIWLMFGCVVFFAFAACLFWQQKVTPESETDSIRLKINGAFITQSDKIPVFAVKYPAANGSVVSLVPLVFGVAITNAGTVPVQLDSLSLSVKSGFWGEWKQLTSVPTLGAEVYWAFDPKNALLARFTRVDAELAGKPLAPNIPVNGWMLFQWPPSFEYPSGKRVQWKFNAEDSAGNKYEYPLPDDDLMPKKGNLKPNSPAMIFDGTKEDLTVYPVRPSHVAQ